MRILFVDPHLSSKSSAPSLNLVTIMTGCLNFGHEVKRVAFEVDDRHFKNLDKFYELEREFSNQIGKMSIEYDVIAVTTTFAVIKRTEMILAAAKKHNPSIKTIIGGGFTHYLLLCSEWLQSLRNCCPSLDYIVVGEGEEIIIDLLNNLYTELPVAGVIYCNGESKFGGIRKPITDLDSLPINNYAGHDLTGVSFLRVLASRGCPYSCSFCEVCLQWGGKYRARSEKSVTAEIANIVQNAGITKIRFADSTFTLHPRLRQVCDGIKKFGVEWVAYARVSDITDEKLEYMKTSGCKGLYFGIEAGNDKTLEEVDKKITSETIRNAVRKTKKHGIKVSGTMILGLPNETVDDIRETINFTKGLDLDGYSWHRYMYPAELIVKDKNLIKRFDWQKFETDVPYELIPELVWKYPETSEDMHVPIILAELKETNLPAVPVNSNINLPEYVKLLSTELEGYMSECAQQNEVRVMNSTVERMLS
jgi:radical SAM superfamily enzyme YgiQ (UPF0313 family)